MRKQKLMIFIVIALLPTIQVPPHYQPHEQAICQKNYCRSVVYIARVSWFSPWCHPPVTSACHHIVISSHHHNIVISSSSHHHILMIFMMSRVSPPAPPSPHAAPACPTPPAPGAQLSLHITHQGHIWSYLVIFDHIWSYLVMFCHI